MLAVTWKSTDLSVRIGIAKELRFRWDETAGLVERYSVHNALKGAIGDQP